MVKEMNLNSYKEFMDDVFEMSKDFVVVEGAIDIELHENNIGSISFKTYKTREIPWIWVVMGKPHEEMIEELFERWPEKIFRFIKCFHAALHQQLAQHPMNVELLLQFINRVFICLFYPPALLHLFF